MWDALFSGNTLFFSVPAIAGTLFFLLNLTLSFIGIELDGVDSHAGGADLAVGDAHHSTHAFKVLSIQSIGSFIMGFGWGGLGGLKGADWGFGGALASAIVGGILMVWLLTWLLKIVHDLQSTGTLPIHAAMGAQGEVYANIPAHGQGGGQVRLVVNERQRIYNAVSDGEALTTSTQVQVVRVNENNTVTVAPLD
jgi:hypothetical protein